MKICLFEKFLSFAIQLLYKWYFESVGSLKKSEHQSSYDNPIPNCWELVSRNFLKFFSHLSEKKIEKFDKRLEFREISRHQFLKGAFYCIDVALHCIVIAVISTTMTVTFLIQLFIAILCESHSYGSINIYNEILKTRILLIKVDEVDIFESILWNFFLLFFFSVTLQT